MAENIEKDWTIMVYMSGDNNLSESMAKAIYDARKNIKSNGKVSLLVYFDSKVSAIEPKYYDITNFENSINVKDSRTFKKFIKETNLSKSIKENSSSKNSIVNFVEWCVSENQNRASNYALFLSGHSNAFDDSTLLKDGNSKMVLTIPELKKTLKQINKIIKTKQDPQKTLDIIGFDSCVMNLLEISYQFKGLAKYMIASQGNTPAAGFDYAKILNDSVLSSSDKIDAEYLANRIVENFIDQQEAFLAGGRSADLSALDLNHTTSLIKQVKKLFNLIYELRKQEIDRFLDKYPHLFNDEGKRKGLKFIVANQIEKLLLSAHWNCQTYWFDQAIDIYDFCEKLLLDIVPLNLQFVIFDDPNSMVMKDIFGEISDASKEIMKIIEDKFVIATGSCGAEFQFARGTSLFFPWSVKAYRELALPYLNLDFSKKNIGDFWIKFIEDYLFCTLKRVGTKGEKSLSQFNGSAKNNGNALNKLISTKGSSTDKDRGMVSAFVRGTSTDKDRGTSTDKDRGTSTDKDRGAVFYDSFSAFKNFDPDNWNYLEKSSIKRKNKNRKNENETFLKILKA